MSAGALAALARHSWSGNVRELANLIERLSIVCGGRMVEPIDLPARYQSGADLTPSLSSDGPTDVARLAANEEPAPANAAITDTDVLRLLETGDLDSAAAAPAPTGALASPETLGELPADGVDLRVYLASIERRLIEQALARVNGTVAHAAQLLNLRRTTLVEKLRKLGIDTGYATDG
jgi:sigma-54 dependent transcriptional regulator, flagellar regulatory protein